MKIIDLLNKISKGKEVPKNIKVFGEEFNYDGYDYYSIHSSSPLMSYVGEDYLRTEMNCEVEIIEEEKKIPEKLNYQYRNLYGRLSQHKQSEIDIIDTLNDVIDYLKSKGE